MDFGSLTVDTACSSSLYALHLACQSLLAGDCTAALVGGSNLIMSVEKQLGSESLGVLSPSSTCHTFDESADGFGRGDGIAALYIKRLSDAINDGDPIRAVIRATAVNS
jgi:acyl transferase domain-containing protein